MILGKGAFPVHRRHDGRLQEVGEFREFVGCLGVKHALSRKDHRMRRREQQFGCFVHILRVWR